ncbi:MAG: O-antigen ligase family protein [Flavobacteriales bacterium]
MFQRNEIVGKFNVVHVSAMLVAVLIPLNKKMVPIALILLFLSTLVYYKQTRKPFTFSLALISLALLYLLHVAGMLVTTDMAEGWFALELKMSMLFIPLYFLLFKPFTAQQTKLILLAFIAGCFGYSVVGFVGSIKNYTGDGDTDWFFSGKISYDIHPTYMAMYICTAILCISAWLIQSWKKLHMGVKIGFLLLLPYFSVFVLLLASKGGIIGLAVTWMAIVMYFFYYIGRWYIGIGAVVLALAGLVYLIKYPTVTRWKFEKATEIYYMPVDSVIALYSESTESNAVRRMVWHVSWECVKQNPMGEGTGDSQNHLHAEFKKRGITGAYKHKLNCHNQYLETIMAVGIPGLLLFIIFLLAGIWNGIREKKFILIWLIIIAMVNMLFESMFETQTGVVFLSFFICMLIASPAANEFSDDKMN